MKKGIILCFLFGLGMIFFACQRKHVCPAYQSAFLLDETKTQSFFSQFEDSIPRSSLFVNKNKRGIMVRVRYQEKQKDIYNVKMKVIYPPSADSLLLAGFDRASMNDEQIDSILTLSPVRRASYNREQEIYMQHIGQFSLKKEPETEQANLVEDPVPVQEPPMKRKWFWNKNKKQKEDLVDEEEEDLDDMQNKF